MNDTKQHKPRLLYPDEYKRTHSTLTRTGVASWLLAGSLWVTIGVAMTTKDMNIRRFVLAMGVTLGYAYTQVKKVNVEYEYLVNDHSDVSDQSTTNRLYEAMRPEVMLKTVKAEVVDVEPVDVRPIIDLVPFRWQDLAEKRDQYAHISLEAKTGGGKSTLAEWLASLMGGVTIAVDTHYEVGHYPSVDRVVGAGRRFGTSAEEYEVLTTDPKTGREYFEPVVKGEPPVKFKDIVEGRGNPTAAQFIRSLHTEMIERFQLINGVYRWKVEQRPLISVIFDEFNSYANLPGVNGCLKELIREARKAGIRLIFLIQGSEVKAMGIEGESSLRENLTRVRLRNFAKSYAKAQQGSKKKDSDEFFYWSAVGEVLRSNDFACLVEDDIAIVPYIQRPQLDDNRVATTVEDEPVDTSFYEPDIDDSEPDEDDDEPEETTVNRPALIGAHKVLFEYVKRRPNSTVRTIQKNCTAVKNHLHGDGKVSEQIKQRLTELVDLGYLGMTVDGEFYPSDDETDEAI